MIISLSSLSLRIPFSYLVQGVQAPVIALAGSGVVPGVVMPPSQRADLWLWE
jgi:hypothetical protein